MRSLIGRQKAWNTTEENPYIVYSHGIKEEGSQMPALYASPELAMNALMQTIVDLIRENADKNIIWRRFPSVDSVVTLCPNTKEYTTWYKATARLCFET